MTTNEHESAGAIINIGRLADNDLVLPQRVVSRIHATLEWQADRALLTDQHSSNGTFVNSTRISQPTELQRGDRVRFAVNGPELRFPDDFPAVQRSTQEPQRPETVVYREELRKIVNDTMARVRQAAQASRVLPAPVAPPRRTVIVCNHFRDLAKISPRSAVCEAWRHLENALSHRHKALLHRWPPSCGHWICEFLNELGKRHIISEADVRALNDLREIRNHAAHHTTFVLMASQAQAYAAQVLNYARALQPAILDQLYQHICANQT